MNNYYGQPQYQQQGYSNVPPYQQPPNEADQWFAAVDQDKNGHINSIELQQALNNNNWSHFNAETCRMMIGMFDRNQNGMIDINEFRSLWNYIQQWKATFEGFDRDRSGFIDANELNNAFNQMGYRTSPLFAQLVVTRFDVQARSKLSLDAFIQACVLLQSITTTFRQKDTSMTGSVKISYEDFMTMAMLNKP